MWISFEALLYSFKLNLIQIYLSSFLLLLAVLAYFALLFP